MTKFNPDNVTGIQALKIIGGLIFLTSLPIVLFASCSALMQSDPASIDPAVSATPSAPPTISKPEPTSDQIRAVENTDKCWNIVDSTYGFENPKGDVVGAYRGMGYEPEDLDGMYDLTRMAAVGLMEPGATDSSVKTSIDPDPLVARIVLDVTKNVYLPRHRAIAAEKCVE